MLNINDILYKYITEKYGSIADFADYSGISPIELNAILLKDNISIDIRSGLKLCKKLNIDVEKLIFNGEIDEINSENSPNSDNTKNTDGNTISENELHDRYMRLSELEKKEVLEFVNKISGRHEK
ncbi:MAG: hypothetical protein FWD71_11510 [Oscillospiraceae bacterium]|nr:hypothetical protein [Oscillospiraceae bacterium]